MAAPIFRSPTAFRLLLSAYPPYWGTGIAVREVTADWRRVVVQMKQRPWNVNAFGTHFGGSLYAMCDPFYVLMLVPLLGPDYVVWDKAAAIDFVKPGKGTVVATFDWSDAQLQEIRERTAGGAKFEPQRTLQVVDAAGEVVARVNKTLYVRRKRSG